MKTETILSLVGPMLLGTVSAAAELNPVRVQVTRQQFASGDSITIQEVVASSADLKAGDTVVVRGSYTLKSRPHGSLGLFLTTKGSSAPAEVSPAQTQRIAAGAGTFELQHLIPADGFLHVSFYPESSGSSFGGISFGASNR